MASAGAPDLAGLAFNGKFLTARPTGVHRVAYELLTAMDALDFTVAGRPMPARLLAPRGEIARPAYAHLPIEPCGVTRAQLWEQFDLPWIGRHELIVNFCNLGPAIARNAITMIHDAQVYITPESYSRTFLAWYRGLLPKLGRRHRRILTVSEYSRQQLAAHGVAPLDRIEVVHNGVDHILAQPAESDAANRLGLVPGRYVVALANIQAHKNVGVLLRAFADPGLADIRLVLIGSADRDAFVAAGHSVPANTLFAGRVSDPALRGLLEQALCLAFPSTTEGFGLPPLEAMLVGCPAVVAPCGALPEVCGDAALYASENDPPAWAAAIRRLADDGDQRMALVEKGRAHAELFTWARAARRVLDIVGDVLGRS